MAIGIRGRDMVLPRARQIEAAMEIGERGQSGTVGARAMIAPFERDELLLLRLTDRVVIVNDVADGTVDRIRSTQREIDMVEPSGREAGQLACEPDCRFVGEMEVARRVWELAHLFRGAAFDFRVLAFDAPAFVRPIDHRRPTGARTRHAEERQREKERSF